MEKRRNAVALGLLVLVATGLFLWGFFFLLGNPIFTSGMDVVVVSQDGGGLKRGDRVNLRGVQVGSVRRVELEPTGEVAVRLRLDDKLRLPADTRAAVRGDVFGAHSVELIPGTALLAVQPGDTLPGMTVPLLTDVIASLGGQARTVLEAADSLLGPGAIQDVHSTAAVLPASAENLRDAFIELRAATASLRRSAEEVEAAGSGAALGSALARLEESADRLSGAAGAAESSLGSLASILAKVDEGEGTLGRLVNDRTLYEELTSVLTEVRALAADVRAQPGRYIQFRIF